MSDLRSFPPTTEETTSLGVAPVDACEEAAARLLVVIRLLGEHGDPGMMPDEDDGGYDLSIARDALCHVRELLLGAVRADTAEQGGVR